jgi:phosphoribosylformylglycinamidine cyclo-ligase
MPRVSDAYESAGVDYDVLDSAKRTALASAATTERLTPLADVEFAPRMGSQGEPAFVFRADGSNLATVLECLGTKSVIAREYADQGGPNLYRHVGLDAVAAIVNDLACVGAVPLVVHAYFATGSAAWYGDAGRFTELVEGWRQGCERSGAVWGGGESPTLAGLVAERDIEIAGSAVGFVPGEPVLGEELAAGDEIVLVESTGLHANGSSLVRATAARLDDGYRTRLDDGRELGEAALDASAFYVGLVAELARAADVRVSYYSHITGHGFRKIMRADKALTYRITELPPVPPFLTALCGYTGMDDRAAYGTLNMGAGFAVFAPAGEGRKVVDVARRVGLAAAVCGVVEEGPRRVIVEPIDAVYEQDELRLRRDTP